MFDKALSGGLRWNKPPFDVTASNITQDKETGIGAWSDADLKTFLTTGVRPNGCPGRSRYAHGFLQSHDRARP
jgi:hypothetical protein